MIKWICVCVICLCVALAAFYSSVEIKMATQVSAERLRDALLLEQHAQQKIHRLNHSDGEPLLNVLGEAATDLQIRLAEALLHIQDNQANALIYEQITLAETLLLDHSNKALSLIGSDSARIHRLDIQGQVSHGRAFLQLFDHIGKAIQGWPNEIRACSIQKSVDKKLHFHCALDTYFWATTANGQTLQ